MKTVNVDSVVAFWTDDLKLITSDSDIDGKEALWYFQARDNVSNP